MSATQHTPGPWKPNRDRVEAPQLADPNAGRDMSLIATVNIQRIDGYVNATLIAAAPELAEALHDVLAYYAPKALGCDDWALSGNTQTDAILRSARAALLKAGIKL